MKFKWMKNLHDVSHGTKWIMFIHLNNTALSCAIKHVVFKKGEHYIKDFPQLLRLRASLHHGP